MKIAHDGYPLIGFVFFMFIGSLFFSPPVGFVLAPLLGLMVWFFRDPERVPDGPGFLSPADGRVVEILKTSHPFTGEALRIGIFMNPLDVHVNRAPAAGTVRWLEYVPGKRLPAFRPKASELNERMYVGLDTEHGPLLLVQIAGFLARRIVCRLRRGEELGLGERFGMIKLGSRVDVYLPPEVRAEVKLGERVFAGRTVLGGMAVEK